jgi:hypothetical protein
VSAQLVLIVLLSVSVLINIIFFWYTRNILAKLLFVSENISDLMEMTNRFVNHVDEIHKMEMFYGDETLGHLIEHSQDLAQQFEIFEQTLMLIEGDEELDIETNIEADQTPA